eukprot:13614146-Alexandrium_andersonii.AAC.1
MLLRAAQSSSSLPCVASGVLRIAVFGLRAGVSRGVSSYSVGSCCSKLQIPGPFWSHLLRGAY